MTIEQLKYPVGKFERPEIITKDHIRTWILEISDFPGKLKMEVDHLTYEQLDTPYRPEGWTVRQVVHHCADSHMNSFIRFKLTLTEDKPTIKTYREDRWAELFDGKDMPVEHSLMLLKGLHARWVELLKSLTDDDLQRKLIHPDQGEEIPISRLIGLYAWHCRHHLAHITELKKRKNWD